MSDVRPTFDEMYLANRINEAWESRGEITPGAIVRWHKRHGIEATVGALRMVRGFLPDATHTSAYAYADAILTHPAGTAL